MFGKSVDAPVYAACGDLEPLPIAPRIVPRTLTLRPGVGEPYTLDWEIGQGSSRSSPEVTAMFKERRPR